MILNISEIVKYAKEFRQATGFDRFIPCGHDGSKKPPIGKNGKKIDSKKAEATAEELEQYPNMLCLGIVPGGRFVALDCDGTNAINLLMELQAVNGILPETLHVGSKPGEREALIFELPDEYQGKIPYFVMSCGGGEQLEIRTGDKYQVVYGSHPLNGSYQQITDIIKPAVLPAEWCRMLIDRNNERLGLNSTDDLKSNGKTNGKKSNGNGHKSQVTYEINEDDEDRVDQELNLLDMIIELLAAIDDPLGDLSNYDNWLNAGMVYHSIDSSLKGVTRWDNISQLFEGYKEGACDKKWGTFNSDKRNAKTIATYVKKWQSYTSDDGKKITEAIEKATEPERVQDLIDRIGTITINYSDDGDDVSLTGYFDDLFSALIVDQNVNVRDRLFRISKQTRLYTSVVIDEWERYEKLKSIDHAAQSEAIKAYQKSLTFDVRDIYRSIPDGMKVYDAAVTLKLDPFIQLMYLLAAVGGVCKKDRLVKFSKDPCNINLFVIMNATSGKGKSPSQTFFTKMMNFLDASNRAIDDKNKQIFRKADRKWRNAGKEDRKFLSQPAYYNDKEELVYPETYTPADQFANGWEDGKVENTDPPEEPEELRHWIFDEGTPEALMQTQVRTKSHNITWVIDEFVKVIGTMRGYNNNDKTQIFSRLIEIWNGSNIKKITKAEGTISGKWGISIIGGIQPDLLRLYLCVENDPQGFIARCLFIDGSHLDHEPDIDENANVDNLLLSWYRCISELPGGTMQPRDKEDPIWLMWIEFFREVYGLAESGDHSAAFKNWLHKLAQNVAKIAGCLHTLKAALEPSQNHLMMSEETMRQAIELGRYLLEHHRKLFDAVLIPEGADRDLTRDQVFILEFMQKQNKPVNKRQLVMHNHFKSRKMKTSDVQEILNTLTASHIEVSSDGNYRLKSN